MLNGCHPCWFNDNFGKLIYKLDKKMAGEKKEEGKERDREGKVLSC